MTARHILSFYYQNANGLRTKSNEFITGVLNSNYDIICITETWLNDGFYSREFFDNRYEVYRCDRDRAATGRERGGGLLVAVRRELCARPAPDWCAPPPADELWVSVPLGKPVPAQSDTLTGQVRYLHIGLTYIPHGRSHEALMNSFYDRTCQNICTNSDDIFLVLGDFNVTNAIWSYDEEINSMNINTNNDNLAIVTAEFIHFSGIRQYNAEFNYHNRILDLVFCSKPCKVFSVKNPLVTEDRHHKSLEIELSLLFPPPPLKHNKTVKIMFFKADYESIRSELSSIDWVTVFSSYNDINMITNAFYSILNSLIDKYVPITTRINQKYPPWYTKPLIKLGNEKCKFHKKFKVYQNLSDYRTFSTLRKRFRKMERDCYEYYINVSEDNINRNPKYFWTFVKSKKSNNDIPNTITYKGDSLYEGSQICNAFNDYFHSVFISSNDSTLDHSSGSVADIDSVKIDEKCVLSELRKLNIYTSAGSDGIHPLFIKQCANEILVPLLYIYRFSLLSGNFPSVWKKALITPIPKTSQSNDVTQYRPISKLCTFGKIIEKIVTTQISSAVKQELSENQHGFVKARSVDSNMVVFSDYLLNAMDSNLQVDVVYTDFSKAFDKINHDLLLVKLMRAGVHGNLLRWIESYIRNRSQAVCLKGYCSRFLHIPSGVPQGSHLGPLLFTLYINDLGKILGNSDHLLYADDTKLFRKVFSIEDSMGIQRDLNSLLNYCNTNQLFLNVEKCFVITYTRKKKPIMFDYTINNLKLVRVNSIRDLGVMMDSKVSFNPHIDNILNRAFKNLGFITRISKPLKKISTLKLLYNSFVRSILEFASVVWNPSYQIHINRIEKVQKKFVKLLNYRCHRLDSYENSLNYYNLTSLLNRRKLIDMSFLFKILNNLIDSPTLLSKINFVTRIRMPIRTTRNKNNVALVPPNLKKNYTRNSFISRSITTYNKEFSDVDLFNNNLISFKRTVSKACNNK